MNPTQVRKFISERYPELREDQQNNIYTLMMMKQYGEMLVIKEAVCQEFEEWLKTK